jgi:hypothetical protein
VRLRGRDDRRVTIGTKAASKLLVVVRSLVLLASLAVPAAAQSPTPFEITDNSFLVEEAFNQEPGIFQNIFNIRADDDVWLATFTQEWPLFTQTHQLSYTLSFGSLVDRAGFGDTAVHYRFQWFTETADRPAVSPRVSLLLPTGSEEKFLSTGSYGWEVNLPVSKQVGDFYVHGNAGFSHFPQVDTVIPRIAGSAIWRARPMLNLMLEAVGEFPPGEFGDRNKVFTLSPGLRGGWNHGEDAQTILGIAMPITMSGGEESFSVLAYASYELPF